MRLLVVDRFLDSKIATKKDEEELKILINELDDEKLKDELIKNISSKKNLKDDVSDKKTLGSESVIVDPANLTDAE